MGVFKSGLENLGRSVSRISSPAVNKDATWDRALPAAFRAGPFNRYDTHKQQLNAYTDWVFSAVSAIAEESASVDFRLFVNRTSRSNRSLGWRLAYKPELVRDLFDTTVKVSYRYAKKVYTRQLAALEELDDHQVLDLLNRPNRWMDKEEFFERAYQHLELVGETFMLKIRDNRGVVVELWPLMPDGIEVIPDASQFIRGYIYHINGKRVPIDVEDLIHVKRTDPKNLTRGMGVVEAAARAIDTDNQSADYNRRFFKNAARPDGTLQTEQQLDDKAFNRLKKEFHNEYAGTDNAHKVALLEAGVQFKPVNFNQKEMEFLQGRKFNRDQILALFRVSPAIIGMVEDVNRSNAEASEYIFSKRVVKHKMQRMVSALTANLAAEFDEKLIISFSDPVPADKEFDLKAKQQAVNTWMTIDEVREMDGMDPLPDGKGAVIYQPISQQPLGFGGGQSQQQQQLSTASGKAGDNRKKKLNKSEGRDLYADEEERQRLTNIRSEFVERAAPQYEDEMIEESKRRFNQQRLEVLRNIRESDYRPAENAYSKSQRKDLLSDFMFDVGDENRLMAAAYAPIYEQMIEEFGQQAVLMVSATGEFDMTDEAVSDFYNDRSERIAKDVNLETEKQLRATLSEGINAGESVDQLSDRVNTTMGNIAEYRGRRIARTESIRTNTFADVQGWTQTGQVSYKEWSIAGGDACIWCLSMDGTKTQLQTNYFDVGDSLFTEDENGNQQRLDISYENIQGPPIHPNCRCVLLPVLRDL